MAAGTNLSNWRDPDRMTWSFQNVDKILPVDTIAKSSKITPLPRRHHQPSFAGFEVSTVDGRKLNLASFLTEVQTDGLVLLKDGDVVFEHYDRTNAEDSVHATFSITKSVTGLLSGILVASGELDANALLTKYVPEVRETSYEHITVRQLLDMRAGIDYEDGPEYGSACGLRPLKADETATDIPSFIATFQAPASAPVDGLEGNPFYYLSINADLMGWILERASGKRYADLVCERLWQPIGAESDAKMALDRGGNAIAAMGFCATVRDLARLGQEMLSKASQIIPESWMQDLLMNGDEEAFAAGEGKAEFEEVFRSVAYRSFWTVDKETETLMALGLSGQCLLVDRKHGLVLALSASQPERTNWDKVRLTLRAFQVFTRILKDEQST